MISIVKIKQDGVMQSMWEKTLAWDIKESLPKKWHFSWWEERIQLRANAKAFFLPPFIFDTAQDSSKMVSTNSALTALACRIFHPKMLVSTAPIQRESWLSLHPPPQFHFLCFLRQADYLPLLVMATVQLCARSLAGVDGIGVFPSHVLDWR